MAHPGGQAQTIRNSKQTSERERDGQPPAQPTDWGGGLKAYRATQWQEIAEVLEIGREFHGESRFGRFAFSEDKFAKLFGRSIADPDDSIAVYVQLNGKTVGVLSAAIGDYYLSAEARLATIYILYVSASVRHSLLGGRVGIKLIRMVSDWAKAQGAEELHIHATSGIAPKQTDKMLKRLGFETYGGNYVGRVG